ncbi:hypothetical protein M8A51_23465 [Schlegelella sp. S2-27]|uniref:Uncharacterized protein n=1 Tax=Caldimonas mangrovi TaxID=2944811 RepID=A0ABT0YVR5_9BURK|nr:hypothetical protein [Caldimonas mangrovi]MCM5682499.1 hypothetical protein [Caldimonas mangrovi]
MSDIKLPELPKRFDAICALNECGDIEEVQVYTAEQMQEYAKQAAEMERERFGEEAAKMAEVWDWSLAQSIRARSRS